MYVGSSIGQNSKLAVVELAASATVPGVMEMVTVAVRTIRAAVF